MHTALPYCIFLFCYFGHWYKDKISFHELPSDEAVRMKWLSAVIARRLVQLQLFQINFFNYLFVPYMAYFIQMQKLILYLLVTFIHFIVGWLVIRLLGLSAGFKNPV